MNERLEGGCQVPIGSFATLDGDVLTLTGMVGKPDGSELLFASATASRENAKDIGVEVALNIVKRLGIIHLFKAYFPKC